MSRRVLRRNSRYGYVCFGGRVYRVPVRVVEVLEERGRDVDVRDEVVKLVHSRGADEGDGRVTLLAELDAVLD